MIVKHYKVTEQRAKEYFQNEIDMFTLLDFQKQKGIFKVFTFNDFVNLINSGGVTYKGKPVKLI